MPGIDYNAPDVLYNDPSWFYNGLYSSIPPVTIEIGFAAKPLDALSGVTWTDVSSDARAFTITRGRQHELDTFQAGTAEVVLNNRDRDYDPINTGSPHNPNVKPMRRIRISAQWESTTYRLFTGYIEAWDQLYGGPNDAITVVRCVDAFKLFNLLRPEKVPYSVEVLADTPDVFWRFRETVGSAVDDSTTNNRDGSRGSRAFPSDATPLHEANAGRCLLFETNSAASITSSTAFNYAHTDSFSVSFWLKTLETSEGSGGDINLIRRFDTGAPAKGWQVAIEDATGGKLILKLLGVNLGISRRIDVRTPFSAADDPWHHYVVTYSGTGTAAGVTWYRDGKPSGQQTVTDNFAGTMQTATADFVVGPGAADPQNIIQLAEVAVFPSALSAAAVERHYLAGVTPWGNQRSNDRVSSLLTLVGWPSADRDINTGVATLGPLAAPITSILEAAQAAADSEAGAFYMGADGKVRFDHRHINIHNSTSVATFGDADGEKPYMELIPAYDDINIFTEVHCTRPGGVTQVERATGTQQTDYGVRVLAREGQWADDNQAQGLGKKLLQRFQDPVLRFSAMVVPQTSDMWPQILGRDLHRERVTVKRRPPGGGSAISQECWIEGVQHTVSPGRWEAVFSLVPAEANITNPFTLGSSALNSGHQLSV